MGCGTSRPTCRRPTPRTRTTTLRPHTDGTYSQDAPGLQLLHCLAFDGTGGRVDHGRRLPRRRPAAQSPSPTCTRCCRRSRYPGSTSVTASTCAPLVRCSDTVPTARSNRSRSTTPTEPRSRCPSTRCDGSTKHSGPSSDGSTTSGCSGDASTRRATRCCSTTGGSCTVALAYTGHRHLCGCYVNREDYLSRRRMLARH